MTINSVTGLVEALRESRLLNPAQAGELAGDLPSRYADPRGLAREVMQRGWLTAYQINQVYQGRAAELFVEQYVLLERIGEGGMGQVFKARHRKMGRLVALKVLRRDRAVSAEAVKRFEREVEAAARLSHPNIVTAYDAGEAGGTCFFAMEYIDGPDLGKLVKRKGPVPVFTACEYVRQVAMGLQHAHGKGMVHRDIKPSNLLLASSRRTPTQGPHSPALGGPSRLTGPVVKILDMGLARLCPVGVPETDGTLTQAQSVLGTPDFIAPEQARSARAADIRSDLYSLGCTFYYLLTGQVPFPADLPMEKLLKHYLEEAPRVEALRPEVPAAVGRVVRRLMAKDPAERYQTPAELAAALGALGAGRMPAPLATPVPTPVPDEPGEPAADEPRMFDTITDLKNEFDTNNSLPALAGAVPVAAPKPRRGRAARVLVAALVFVLTTGLIFLLLWAGRRA